PQAADVQAAPGLEGQDEQSLKLSNRVQRHCPVRPDNAADPVVDWGVTVAQFRSSAESRKLQAQVAVSARARRSGEAKPTSGVAATPAAASSSVSRGPIRPPSAPPMSAPAKPAMPRPVAKAPAARPSSAAGSTLWRRLVWAISP